MAAVVAQDSIVLDNPPPVQTAVEIQTELAKLTVKRSWYQCRCYAVLENNKLVCRTLYWAEIFGYWDTGTSAKIADIANFFTRPNVATPAELNTLFEHYLTKKIQRPDQFTSTDIQTVARIIHDFRPGAVPESSAQRLVMLIGQALRNKQFEQAFTFFSRLPLDEQLAELAAEEGIATRLSEKLVQENREFLVSLQGAALDKENKKAQNALFLLLYPQKARLAEIEFALQDVQPDYPTVLQKIDLLEMHAFDSDDKHLIMSIITNVLTDDAPEAREVANGLFSRLQGGARYEQLPMTKIRLAQIEFALENQDGGPDYPKALQVIKQFKNAIFDEDEKKLLMNLVTKALVDEALEFAKALFCALPEGTRLAHLPQQLPVLLTKNISSTMSPATEQLVLGVVTITEPSALSEADWLFLLAKAIKCNQASLSIMLSSKLPASETLHLNKQYRIQLTAALQNNWAEVANNLLLKIPERAFTTDPGMKETLQNMQRDHLVALSDEANKRLA